MPENVTGFQPTGNLKKPLRDLAYFDMLRSRSPTFFREEPFKLRVVHWFLRHWTPRFGSPASLPICPTLSHIELIARSTTSFSGGRPSPRAESIQCPGIARSISLSPCRAERPPERSATPPIISGSFPSPSAIAGNGDWPFKCSSMPPKIADRCCSQKWASIELLPVKPKTSSTPIQGGAAPGENCHRRDEG